MVYYIAWSHIDCLFRRAAHHIGQLLAPTSFVHLRSIESILTRVHMHPPIAHRLQIDFCPDMICPINDEPSIMAQGFADTREAVCPLSTSAISSLKQLDDLVVSWKTNSLSAFGAKINLNSTSKTFLFLSVWLPHTHALHGAFLWVRASFAQWLICPFEEILLKPSQERLELIDRVRYWHNILRDDRQGDSLSELIFVLLAIRYPGLNSAIKSILLSVVFLDFRSCVLDLVLHAHF